jgi:hypothetical protein
MLVFHVVSPVSYSVTKLMLKTHLAFQAKVPIPWQVI